MTTIDSTTRASNGSLGAPQTASTSSDMGPEAFMRLLVTQIRNQDPLEPMDTSAMMSQLTQLTEVERLVAIDGRLQSLQIGTAAIANAQASDLVGTLVEADTSRIDLPDIGTGHGTFELQAPANTVRVEIRDASGDLVRTLELGAMSPGQQSFEWDGKDEHGVRATQGRYAISVRAVDADGNPVSSYTRVRGPVQAIRYDEGFPELSIGNAQVMMGDVRSIEGRPAPAASGTSTGTETP